MSERHAATPEQGAVRPAPSTDRLYDAAWRRLRVRFLERYDNRCEACGRQNGTIHVHHRSYKRAHHERLSDLAALCPACHAFIHALPQHSRGLWFVTRQVIRATKKGTKSPYNVRTKARE